MNTHSIDEGTLRTYSDGALSEAERANVEAHIHDCAACRLMVSEQQSAALQVKNLLGSYLHVSQPALGSAFERAKSRIPAVSASTNAVIPSAPTRAMARRSIARSPRRLPVMAGLGLGLAAALVIAFWLAGFFGTPGGLAGLSTGDFVPVGKVRHLVYTHYNEWVSIDGDAPAPSMEQEDVWLANGKDHLLMYRTLSDHSDDWLLVNNDGAYTYSTSGLWAMTGKQGFGPSRDPAIFRTAYDRRYVAWYLPGSNGIPEQLQQNGPQPVEGGLVGGRTTMMVESVDNMDAVTRVLPAGGASTVVQVRQPFQYLGLTTTTWGSAVGYDINGTPMPRPTETPTVQTKYFRPYIWSMRMDYRLWFDKETNQLLQQQYVTRDTGDGKAGNVYTRTIRLTKLELVDQNSAPPDLFTVKPIAGAASVDAEVVFAPVVLPADKYVLPANNATTTRWYRNTWTQGGFSWLQDRDNTISQNNGEWHRMGSVEGTIEYIAGYRDHTEIVPPDKMDEWLEQQVTELAATMSGTVLRSYPTAPRDGLIGRELTIERKDGRWTLARVYAMGQRMYFIYVTGPNLASFADERTPEFLNSFTITTPRDKLPVVGNVAPDFELYDVRTREPVKLSDLRGKSVVLTFTLIRCVACNSAFTELAKLYPENKNNVAFLSVLIGVNETPDSIGAFIDENNNYEWPILIQDPSSTLQLPEAYNFSTLPAVYFLDRDGVIRGIVTGDKVTGTAFEQGIAKIR